MLSALDQMSLRAYICIQNFFFDFKNSLKSERGDTNFISIIIILGIVVVLAALFIAFKDNIVDKVKEMMNIFMQGWNNQNPDFDKNNSLNPNGRN